MTAPLPVIEVLLDTWTDISGYVQLPTGITVTRGRTNEQSDPDPGVLTFSLDNRDGRFTFGNWSSPYYPYFKRWARVRYTLNGVVQFTGYISSAPTSWNRKVRTLSDVAVTCTDLLGMMQMSPVATSWATELIEELAPAAWWKLDEPEGSTVAVDSAGSADIALSVIDGPAALEDDIKYGTTAPDALESDSVMEFTPSYDSGTATMSYAGGHATLSAIALPFTFLLVHIPNFSNDSALRDGGLGDSHILRTRPNGFYRPLDILRDASGYGLTRNLKFSYYDDAHAVTVPGFFADGEPRLIGIVVTTTGATVLGTGYSASGWSEPVLINDGADLWLGYNPFNHNPVAGATGHLAIIPGAMSEADFAALKAKMVGEGTAAVTTWLNRAGAAAGITASTTATYDRVMHRPALKGSNPAAIGQEFSSASGGMFVADRDGTPKWIDSTYCPPAGDLDATWFTSDLQWEADPSLYYTEIQVDGETRATVDGFPKTARDIPGLLTDADLTDYVDWLAATSEDSGANRLTGITINVWPRDFAETALCLGLDLRSRVRILNPPPQLPPQPLGTVEGYSHTVSDTAWTLTLNTAPDPRFVLDESTLDDYRLRY